MEIGKCYKSGLPSLQPTVIPAHGCVVLGRQTRKSYLQYTAEGSTEDCGKVEEGNCQVASGGQ
jgi:hypothetical protein